MGLNVATNRHFKRKAEELQVLATAALAGVEIKRINVGTTRVYNTKGGMRRTGSVKQNDYLPWIVYLPSGVYFYADTKLQGAKVALDRLENPL